MPQPETASGFGERLLDELGLTTSLSGEADHPAVAWRRAGLLPLSGPADGPARPPPLPITTAVDGAMIALKAISNNAECLPLNGSLLLGERARLTGSKRNGRSTHGGHCRLIDTADGRIAVNLARDDDWGLLEAWLEEPAATWDDISAGATGKLAAELVERGAAMGLPVALDQLCEGQPWFKERAFSKSNSQPSSPLVVDLSSLWAGPLAGSLLHLSGAKLVKVESLNRPDGARRGNEEFYNLLNAGKQSVAFDFASPEGRSGLRRLIAAADIVIEASRPRALRQLGIEAEKLMAEKPGKTWLRFLAHGEDENRIGFGDDIGVAAGLSTIACQAWGEPFFVGDAIADPISGIYGALAAQASWHRGGGRLIELSMRDIVRHAMQEIASGDVLAARAAQWQQIAEADTAELYPMRLTAGQAEELGASSKDIMAALC